MRRVPRDRFFQGTPRTLLVAEPIERMAECPVSRGRPRTAGKGGVQQARRIGVFAGAGELDPLLQRSIPVTANIALGKFGKGEFALAEQRVSTIRSGPFEPEMAGDRRMNRQF